MLHILAKLSSQFLEFPDKQCCEHTCGTSLEVGPPTTERMENETIIKTAPIFECETTMQTTPVINHETMIQRAGCGWNQCEGIAEPFCPTKCVDMVQPKPKQIKIEDGTLCNCPQKFRNLKFPPKCKR
ncbi:uncharacterized protein NPIL_610821 [Nephila pilipes]|uniref:Uncharacterized protein n=1 Tax=Nephila pilipes TaxID=299642 RepID=A0A8X6JAR2_NEPPI|nr:uncharacterized protein NPIL_610821 [Nephila pilipes]